VGNSKEWYGYVLDVQALKDGLGDLKYELQIIEDLTKK